MITAYLKGKVIKDVPIGMLFELLNTIPNKDIPNPADNPVLIVITNKNRFIRADLYYPLSGIRKQSIPEENLNMIINSIGGL